MSEPKFEGRNHSELRIDSIAWETEAVAHMEKRRKEQGVRLVPPEKATEAALDANRIIRLAAGGRSLKVVGRSRSTLRVVKVWLWPRDVELGDWYGASAVDGNDSDIKLYMRSAKEGAS